MEKIRDENENFHKGNSGKRFGKIPVQDENFRYGFYFQTTGVSATVLLALLTFFSRNIFWGFTQFYSDMKNEESFSLNIFLRWAVQMRSPLKNEDILNRSSAGAFIKVLLKLYDCQEKTQMFLFHMNFTFKYYT